MNVVLTRVTNDPILAIEEAASNCYDSTPSSEGRIVRGCYNSGHHAVLEFAHFTFHIEGVSRALLAQLTRHRMASYAVRSQRYCSEDGFTFTTPPSIANNKEALIAYNDYINCSKAYYDTLQKTGIPNEDARFVLPNACNTVIEISMNGRELIHFCNERLCTRAQWEIRELATKMVAELKSHDDQCAQFAKFCVPKCEIHGIKNGFCTEHKSCGRHPKLKNVMLGYDKYTKIEKILSSNSDNNAIIEEIKDICQKNS